MNEHSVAHLITYHYLEVITGAVFIVGAMLLILNKFGWLHFGKTSTEKEIKLQKCPAHDEMLKEQRKIHDNQIKNMAKHEQHQKRFDEGDEEIKKLKKDIKQLCIGVAILLERSGGKPQSFKDII